MKRLSQFTVSYLVDGLECTLSSNLVATAWPLFRLFVYGRYIIVKLYKVPEELQVIQKSMSLGFGRFTTRIHKERILLFMVSWYPRIKLPFTCLSGEQDIKPTFNSCLYIHG